MNYYKFHSDKDLLALLKESDHTAYTEIFNRYFDSLYRHVYTKIRDEEQAKDIIQEIFAALWFNREFLVINTSLGGYLHIAARNRIFDQFAHHKVKESYIRSAQYFLKNIDSAPTDNLIREQQLEAYIQKQITSLPAKMQCMFVMSRKGYLSHKEIAKETGTSENNVSTQICNALKILKGKLAGM